MGLKAKLDEFWAFITALAKQIEQKAETPKKPSKKPSNSQKVKIKKFNFAKISTV